jgi:hypothetical protein
MSVQIRRESHLGKFDRRLVLRVAHSLHVEERRSDRHPQLVADDQICRGRADCLLAFGYFDPRVFDREKHFALGKSASIQITADTLNQIRCGRGVHAPDCARSLYHQTARAE